MTLSYNSGRLRVNVVNVHERRIIDAEISWQDGVIIEIREFSTENTALAYLLPGFVDAHVHIESSMLTPAEFGRIAVRHGTVAAVSDPHEIANVLGLAGVSFMLENARQTPFHILFGAPSCVPATAFETSGARLDAEQLEQLFEQNEVGFLSEVMNVPGVLAGDPDLLAKLQLASRFDRPIDGHAPGLIGSDLKRYADAGISTDHECSTLAEAEAKLACGMHILIREGSAARNFEALQPLISRYPDRVMFCSDDKHPDDLLRGHINLLVARALAKGHQLFDVLQCASLNPIRHYRLAVGQLRVGDQMDAVLVSDLTTVRPQKTWLGGCLVAEHDRSLLASSEVKPLNVFNARQIEPADLRLPCKAEAIRVIKAFDGELLTQEVIMTPKIINGFLMPDPARDMLLLVVVNRYHPEPPIVAFIHGFGLHAGALASSVAHDSHNLIAVGADIDDLCLVVNGLIAQQGGIATVHNHHCTGLALPIAGLMSDQDGDSVARRYSELDGIAKQMGSTLSAPFMTLSFMALLVIPELKLSDQGLFDGRNFRFTGLDVRPLNN